MLFRSLADGNEYDIAIEATLTYTVAVNSCGMADTAKIHEITPSSVAMEIASIAVPLDSLTEEKIALSFLRGSRDRLEQICVEAYNGEFNRCIVSGAR